MANCSTGQYTVGSLFQMRYNIFWLPAEGWAGLLAPRTGVEALLSRSREGAFRRTPQSLASVVGVRSNYSADA